jgi:hypothetical protein
MDTIYTRLTAEFNQQRIRAVICSGQAAVLHRIAIMSKDGDWIIREDDECTTHILTVLGRYHARYRFGAPLDIRWLKHGWSAHLEFVYEGLRIRTDFFSRPPRLPSDEIAALWREGQGPVPVVNLRQLALMKQTNREKDYVVIGETARRMSDPADQLRFSRSAQDLMALALAHSGLIGPLSSERPLLNQIPNGIECLEAALDAERRNLIHTNEKRLQTFALAAEKWQALWPSLLPELENVPLLQAHAMVRERAERVLPFNPELKKDTV